MEEVKFYTTDIIFDQINKKNIKKTKCTSWSNVNQLVSDEFNNESQILEKRKKSNQSIDLFTITNEILKKIGKEPLKKRKCLHCSMPRFHLMKFTCCKGFFCLSCFVTNSMGMENYVCIFCKKPFLSFNCEEFMHMVKSHIVAVWRTMRVIDEERESVLEQKINEALEIQIQNGEYFNLYGIVQYANPQLNIPKKISKLYDEEKSYLEKYLFRPSFRSIIANILVNTFLQKIVLIYLFETNFDLKSYFWDMANFSLVNFIVNQQHTDLDDDIPPELLAKIIFTINECAKIIITWLNILLGYFIFGEPLQEVSKLMFVTGISFSAVSCALFKVKDKLLFDVKKELNYKFL
jgi:hypothetical protein